MHEPDPDARDPERDERPEEPSFDPYAWLSIPRVEAADAPDFPGVPFN